MSTRNEDFLFAQEAQNQGFVTEAQVEEAFLLQRKMAKELDYDERLATILVKQGWLGEEQAKRIYAIIEPEGREAQIEGYRLIHKIGRGAMGTVYKALQIDLNRPVAIKILRRELRGDETQSERLRGEAKILASLDHPNIVRAIQAGESNGFPYVVMEYVEGESLKERIKRTGPLPELEALQITKGIADALERARRMGVVHRDVKPGNVLLDKRSGQPKLMDLGLAKGPIDTELTQQGATVGTPQFISPEQAQDPRKANTQSDIYSLGATLYAMLTGKAPHEGATLAEIIRKVLYEQPVPLRELNRRIRPETSYLVERMMLKDAALRYRTPAEVVHDIDDLIEGRSILPEGFQGSWEAHLTRKRRRRWIKRASLAAVFLVVLVGFGWKITKDRQRNDAEELLHGRLDAAYASARLGADDDARRVRERIAALQGELARIKEFEQTHETVGHWPRQRDIQNRIREFGRVAEHLERLDRFEKTDLDRQLENSNFLAALEILESRVKPPVHDIVRRRQQALADEIRRRSTMAWRAALADHPITAQEDLGALEKAVGERVEALSGRFVTTGDGSDGKELKSSIDLARRVKSQVSELQAAVSHVEQTYTSERLRAALEDADPQAFERISRELDQESLAVRSRFEDAWMSLSSAIGTDYHRQFFDPAAGEVTRRLLEVRRRVRQAGQAHWDDVRERVKEAHDARRFAQALTLLEGVRQRLFRIQELRDERDTVLDMQDALRREQREFQLEGEAFVEQTYRRFFRALARQSAEDLAALLQEARSHRQADVRADELRAAEGLISLLRRINSRAFAQLEADASRKRRFKELRFVDEEGRPSPRNRLILRGAETQGDRRLVRFHAMSGRSGELTVELPHLYLLERIELAQENGLVLSDRERWLVELALLPQRYLDPGSAARDIRPFLRKAQELEREARKNNWDDPLAVELGRLRERFESEQESRQRRAQEQWYRAEQREFQLNLVTALEFAQELLDNKRRHYYTDVRENVQEDALRLIDRVSRELRENEVMRWMPGWRVEEVEGMTRFWADFDDVQQLAAFLHGSGVLRNDQGAVVTRSDKVVDRAFYMLYGAEQLTFGRPLALESPFDPALEIRVEFVLRVGRGCPLLAIDIDGVQIAIASADPNWYEDWVVPPEVRDPDSRPPWRDFYGKGRGIATHAGKDFADPTSGSWDWKAESEGRFYESWKGLGAGEKRRFGLEPGRTHKIKVVRKRDEIELFVNGASVFKQKKEEFGSMGGRRSDVPGTAMRSGSGRLQILSWTPVVIDDLKLQGTLLKAWKKQKAEEEKNK